MVKMGSIMLIMLVRIWVGVLLGVGVVFVDVLGVVGVVMMFGVGEGMCFINGVGVVVGGNKFLLYLVVFRIVLMFCIDIWLLV